MVRPSRIQLIHFSGIAFAFALFFPLVILLVKIPGGLEFTLPQGFLWALQNSIYQALASALLSVVAGGFIAVSLLSRPSESVLRKILERALLAPTLLPTLFSLVICLSIIEPFPFGVIGIAVVHAFINMGLVGVSLTREIERDLAGMTQLAWIEGASRWQLCKALWRLLLQKCQTAFFFVFAICFSSFTVPLMVGGGRGTTLEVLIYEKIRIEANLNAAMSLSLLQSLLVLLLSFLFLANAQGRFNSHPPQRVRLLGISWTFWFVSVIAMLVSVEILAEGIQGWQSVQNIPGLWEMILSLTAPSILAMCWVLVGATVLFLWQLSLYGQSRLQRLITGVVHLSPALVGFSFLLLWGDASIISWSFALTLLFYSSLWRLFAYDQFLTLQGQWEIAELLGASRFQVLKSIILPQMLSAWQQMMGVLAVWTLGEFAISKLVLGREATLGILAGNLMSSYRIQASVFVVFWILGLGFGIYLLFLVGAYVSRTKSS